MRILILVLLLQLSACTAIFNKGSTAYITNQGDNTVSVIDIVQGKVTHTIAVGKAPVGVAVSKSLRRAFITNVESGDISVIDTISNQVIETIRIGGSPVGIAIAPDNKTLYVADWFSDRILAINTASYNPVSYTHLDVYKRQPRDRQPQTFFQQIAHDYSC